MPTPNSMPNSTIPQIECRAVQRLFHSPSGQVTGLNGMTLQVQAGEFVAIQGPSGSGKSTLLLTLGGMLRPTGGHVLFENRDLYALSPAERTQFRARNIGFVFQLFHLIPYLSVRENILIGQTVPNPDLCRSAEALLEELELTHRSRHFPATLSAGERQRVALARALIKKPRVILADEPTGNLDPVNAERVFRHLGDFRKSGGTVIVVTHGQDARGFADRTLFLNNGRIETQSVPRVEPNLVS